MKKHRRNLVSSLPPGGFRPKAFTLVELLVVMMIITLLVGILVPTIGRMRRNTAMAQSQTRISILTGGCQAYYSDFKEYPPSDPGTMKFNTGAQRLVECLVGYLSEGEWNDDLTLKDGTGDGYDGPGFRFTRRGEKYGPYGGAEGLPTQAQQQGRPVFVDAFGYTIFYYRYNADGGANEKYTKADNNADPLGAVATIPDPNVYAKNAGGAYYRTDFILYSAGPDGALKKPGDTSNDDATNFFD